MLDFHPFNDFRERVTLINWVNAKVSVSLFNSFKKLHCLSEVPPQDKKNKCRTMIDT